MCVCERVCDRKTKINFYDSTLPTVTSINLEFENNVNVLLGDIVPM